MLKSKEIFMIEARCVDTDQLVYVQARDIETHDASVDSEGYITFYESNSHKYYKTVIAWPHGGLQEFIDFVDGEVNGGEIENVS